jgi:IS5 family transposase
MKHRAAVEPTTGHCKTEHRMERNRLWAQAGDAVNALLSAASMNFGKLLAAFLRYFIRLLFGSNPTCPVNRHQSDGSPLKLLRFCYI